jgi:ABC-type multidrug transport system fused ATPase/permease subunit
MRGNILPAGAEIFVNGIDIRHVDADSLRNSIFHVSQEDLIFNETVYENLRYGTATISDTKIIETLRSVGLAKFAGNPDFNVGEKGSRLSGGERQRLIIARGILQKKDVLILDEPFSGLDDLSVGLLCAIIEDVAQNNCVLIIDHKNPGQCLPEGIEINRHVMKSMAQEIRIAEGY